MKGFLTVRMPEIGVSKLAGLFDSGDDLIETLKRVYFLTGTVKKQAGKSQNAIDIVHVVQNIALFGWFENIIWRMGRKFTCRFVEVFGQVDK
jgi:hypothetical protein